MFIRPSFFLSLSLLLVTAAAPAVAAEPVRCTVILDVETGDAVHRQGSCDQAFYPQSTFKLPLAMMGYDAGVLVDAHHPRWDYQAKFNRSEREQKATDPTIWEHDSIVWYSQEITRRLGKEAFANYVHRFAYGNQDVSGGPGGTASGGCAEPGRAAAGVLGRRAGIGSPGP